MNNLLFASLLLLMPTSVENIHYERADEIVEFHRELIEEAIEANPKLTTCRIELQLLAGMLWYFLPDSFLVFECHRTLAKQREYLAKGVTKTLNSKHLDDPSSAMDIVPRIDGKLDWNDTEQLVLFHGHGRVIWFTLKQFYGFTSNLRSGLSWDGSGIIKKNKFRDFYHFEIVEDGRGYSDEEEFF